MREHTFTVRKDDVPKTDISYLQGLEGTLRAEGFSIERQRTNMTDETSARFIDGGGAQIDYIPFNLKNTRVILFSVKSILEGQTKYIADQIKNYSRHEGYLIQDDLIRGFEDPKSII